MIFIVYDSAQPPVQILLYTFCWSFSSAYQSAARVDNRTETNAVADTAAD